MSKQSNLERRRGAAFDERALQRQRNNAESPCERRDLVSEGTPLTLRTAIVRPAGRIFVAYVAEPLVDFHVLETISTSPYWHP